MKFEESIVKKGEGYIVKTEVAATEAELIKHLKKITGIKKGYEEEVKLLTKGIELTDEQKQLKDDLDKLDELKALEVHKTTVGNADKRLREINAAIETVNQQIKNREALFPDEKPKE